MQECAKLCVKLFVTKITSQSLGSFRVCQRYRRMVSLCCGHVKCVTFSEEWFLSGSIKLSNPSSLVVLYQSFKLEIGTVAAPI